MTKKLLTLAVAIAALVLVSPVQAQDASWIHVRVDEQDGAKVNVNLPFSLIEVALELAQDEIMSGEHGPMRDGHISIGHGDHDLDVADLRRMWSELRASGDAEYVNVQDDGEQVRIYREGDVVYINVSEGDTENVRVQVPFAVVDTLLEGEGDELNLVGAVRQLASSNNGEIISVNDGETTVRVWIDTNSGS